MTNILTAMTSHSLPESECLDSAALDQRIADGYNRSSGNLNEEDGYDCPKCRNKGDLCVIVDGYRIMKPCSCQGARKSIRLLKRSGLESLVSRCRLEDYQRPEDWQEAAYQAARAYADEPQGWLAISGRSGTGKTHLCVGVCRELMLKGMSTRYMMWRDEIGQIKFGDREERQEAVRKYQRVPVLYIDDFLKVGKGEEPTSADLSLAFEILNARYNDPDKLTIISTELTMGEILQMDEAVGSRIYERTKGRFIQFAKNAQNWRMRENPV